MLLSCKQKVQGARTMGMGASRIECTLVVDTSSPKYPATVSVVNSTEHPIRLYKVFIPRDGLSLVDMFIVKRDGVRLPYQGAMAKLPGKPADDDFLPVPPGGRTSATVPLSDNYDLKLPGKYSVRYSIAHPQPGGGTLDLVTNEVSFTVQQKPSQ
jgi:hypothetical protein